MHRTQMASAKERASARLAALRSNHDLCEASITVRGEHFPIHLAIVAEISPVFKKALCGDFKEGQNKSLALNFSSPAVVNIILDYAYGVFQPKQLSDFSLCLDVWMTAHMYSVEGLVEEASKAAFREVTVSNLVDLVQHSTLYGSDEDYSHACRFVAFYFGEVSRNCRSFGSLRFHEMVQILSSNYLVGKEDEILSATMQWVKCNPKAGRYEIDGLFACIRMERLTDLDRIEALCASVTCPPSLVRQSTRICFHRMKAEVAMSKIGRYIANVQPESARFFVNGVDSLRGNRTHFSCGNFAMAAWVDVGANLCLKVDHLLQRPARKHSLHDEVKSASVSLYIVECTQGARDAYEQRTTNCSVSFEDGAFGGTVPLPVSKCAVRDRAFWVFAVQQAAVPARCRHCGRRGDGRRMGAGLHRGARICGCVARAVASAAKRAANGLADGGRIHEEEEEEDHWDLFNYDEVVEGAQIAGGVAHADAGGVFGAQFEGGHAEIVAPFSEEEVVDDDNAGIVIEVPFVEVVDDATGGEHADDGGHLDGVSDSFVEAAEDNLSAYSFGVANADEGVEFESLDGGDGGVEFESFDEAEDDGGFDSFGEEEFDDGDDYDDGDDFE